MLNALFIEIGFYFLLFVYIEHIIKHFWWLIFREILMVGGNLKKIGDLLKNTKLANTLEKIQMNPYDFYNGSLAQDVVKDIQEKNGIVSMEDLKGYMVSVKGTLPFDFNDLKMHTMPAPGSGAVLAMIINIMHGKRKFYICCHSRFL